MFKSYTHISVHWICVGRSAGKLSEIHAETD